MLARKVDNTELVESALGRWCPNDLAVLLGFQSMANEQHHTILTIESAWQAKSMDSWPDFSDFFYKVSMTFYDVRNLTLKFECPSWQQIMGFDINHIEDHGWDSMCLEVLDYEHGAIAFYCASAIVTSVNGPMKLSRH